MGRIESWYDDKAQQEWQRLDNHRTEFAVTMRVLKDHLPPPPADVLDIGGGPGRYAIELTKQGYEVTLSDVSSRCLESARKRADEAGVQFASVVQADAEDLRRFEDRSFDAVLSMGPLYHLLETEQRRRAVVEAARVLNSNGVVFAVFITTFGVLRYAAKLNPEWIVKHGDDLLATGLPADSLEDGSFPGYFIHPDEIPPLMAHGGFEMLDLVGCEGVVSQIEERINELGGELWDAWVDINYRVGHDPTLHGAADHLLYVGRKGRAGSGP